jgi:hypothetical protein
MILSKSHQQVVDLNPILGGKLFSQGNLRLVG